MNTNAILPTLEFCIEETAPVGENDLESLYQYGQRLFEERKLQECESVQLELLTAVTVSFADDVLLEGTMRDCLVLTYLAQDNFAAAELHAMRALSIYESNGLSDSAAKTLNALGLILTQTGRLADAEAAFTFAIHSMETWILTNHNTVDHVQLVPILSNTAALLRARYGEDNEKAQAMTNRIEAIILAATSTETQN